MLTGFCLPRLSLLKKWAVQKALIIKGIYIMPFFLRLIVDNEGDCGYNAYNYLSYYFGGVSHKTHKQIVKQGRRLYESQTSITGNYRATRGL